MLVCDVDLLLTQVEYIQHTPAAAGLRQVSQQRLPELKPSCTYCSPSVQRDSLLPRCREAEAAFWVPKRGQDACEPDSGMWSAQRHRISSTCGTPHTGRKRTMSAHPNVNGPAAGWSSAVRRGGSAPLQHSSTTGPTSNLSSRQRVQLGILTRSPQVQSCIGVFQIPSSVAKSHFSTCGITKIPHAAVSATC